jgi:hypothetical protein
MHLVFQYSAPKILNIFRPNTCGDLKYLKKCSRARQVRHAAVNPLVEGFSSYHPGVTTTRLSLAAAWLPEDRILPKAQIEDRSRGANVNERFTTTL